MFEFVRPLAELALGGPEALADAPLLLGDFRRCPRSFSLGRK